MPKLIKLRTNGCASCARNAKILPGYPGNYLNLAKAATKVCRLCTTGLTPAKLGLTLQAAFSASVSSLLCGGGSSLEVRVFHSSGRGVDILSVTGGVSYPSDFRTAHHHVGERNRHNCSHTSPG